MSALPANTRRHILRSLERFIKEGYESEADENVCYNFSYPKHIVLRHSVFMLLH